MKVFLAGATGVVGTRALPALVAAGHDVTAVARTPEKARLVARLGGTPVTVDLFDPAALAEVVPDHEAVVNLATSIPTSPRKAAWKLNDRIRREASRNLVDAALGARATRYVQESICFPYLDAGDRWVDEDSPVDHDLWTFAAAGEAERQTARFTSSTSGGGSGVVLRFAQLYAAGSAHTDLMSGLLRRRFNGFPGAGDAYVSMVHAADAGSAVVAALTAPAGIYNVVDDEPMPRRDAGAAAAAVMGVKPPRTLPTWSWRATPPSIRAITRSLRVSHDRLTAVTGWTPAHPSIRTSWPTTTASSTPPPSEEVSP